MSADKYPCIFSRQMEAIVYITYIDLLIYRAWATCGGDSSSSSHARLLSVFMAAILVFQNKETAAVLVYQAIPLGIKLYCYAKSPFALINQYGRWSRE